MADQISNTRLSFTCNQNWDKMKPDNDGRFCTGCQKKVYDLTDKNTAYFLKVMQENNNDVCGRFTTVQVTTPVLSNKSPNWKTWLMTALAIVGISSCKQEAGAQVITLGSQAPKVVEPDCEIKDIVGIVMPTGHIETNHKLQLQKYLFDHCIFPNAFSGQFGITFSLENKKLINMSITGRFSKDSKLKIMKAMKNGIKLISANLKGDFPYQANIIFEKGRVSSVESL